MLFLAWLLFRSMILGVVAGAAWWLIRGRTHRLPRGAVAVTTAVAAGTALLADFLARWMLGPSTMQLPRPDEVAVWLIDMRFALPLILGICAVIVLGFPLPAHTERGAADLSRRTLFSFVDRRWFGGISAIVGAIIAVTVGAGLASEPDEQGLWRLFVVDLGGKAVAGANIYGWFYSLPALALLVVLLLVALIVLWLIARPSIGADRIDDVWVRRLRTRNVVVVVAGALLIHLGTILSSLGGTASLSTDVSAGEFGYATLGTSFAALQPALQVTGFVVPALGYGFWIVVLLSSIPAYRTARASARP